MGANRRARHTVDVHDPPPYGTEQEYFKLPHYPFLNLDDIYLALSFEPKMGYLQNHRLQKGLSQRLFHKLSGPAGRDIPD